MNWENSFLNFKNSALPESIGVNELRQKSFAKFTQAGLPTKNDEAWRFTSLSPFKSIEWKSSEESPGDELDHNRLLEISKLLPSEFSNYVFVNGKLNKTLSDDLDGFLTITEPNEGDFCFDTQFVENRLLNLAQAFLTKTITIELAKSRSLVKPVQILFLQTGAQSFFNSEKLNIRLAENSEMKLIVHSLNLSESVSQALNLNINVNCDYNSRLQFIQLQNEEVNSFHFSQSEVALAANAQFTGLVLTPGGRLVRNYLQVAFVDENAQADVYGVSVLDADQHVDNYTYLQHKKGNNRSTQHYKSILAGASHSVFRGRVLIEPDAQKANSEQLNNNLLLTRTAQVDTIPQLEIYADDVKAGHGATVGQLNKDEIFYFLSRGINQYQAVKMLSYGFATELIHKFESKPIQDFLISALNRKLEKLVQNG